MTDRPQSRHDLHRDLFNNHPVTRSGIQSTRLSRLSFNCIKLTAVMLFCFSSGCQTGNLSPENISATQPSPQQIAQVTKDILKLAEEGILQDNKKAAEFDDSIFIQEYKFDRVIFFVPDKSEHPTEKRPVSESPPVSPFSIDITIPDATLAIIPCLPMNPSERAEFIPENAVRKEWTDIYIVAQEIHYRWSDPTICDIIFTGNPSTPIEATINVKLRIQWRNIIVGNTNIPPVSKGMKAWEANDHYNLPRPASNFYSKNLTWGWNKLPTPWISDGSIKDREKIAEGSKRLKAIPLSNTKEVSYKVVLQFDSGKNAWISKPKDYFPWVPFQLYASEGIPKEYEHSVFDAASFTLPSSQPAEGRK